MNNFVKKIFMEAKVDYGINKYISKISQYMPDLGKKIGQGGNGIAYKYNNHILKLTKSLDETNLSILFMNRPSKYFARIYSVNELYLDEKYTGIFTIEKEILDYLSPDESNIVDIFGDAHEYEDDEIDLNNSELKQYDSTLVDKIYNEYGALLREATKFKLYDLYSWNMGRKKDGTLAVFDAETNISFPNPFKKIPKLYLNSFKNENLDESVLTEWNDTFPNTQNQPGYLSNDFETYMSEATAESLTMETGAIPNSLDETIKIEEYINHH